MILVWLLVILMIGGLLAWLVNQWSQVLSKTIALLGALIPLAISVFYWCLTGFPVNSGEETAWITSVQASWIPSLGIDFYLALDGLSLLMVVLTTLIGTLTVLFSWGTVQYQEGFYYFNLLWVLAGITGVFLAMDLFLFYFMWEVMLIPMYFIVGIWGGENRYNAAFKFFIFTQAGGLLMLLAILGLHTLHWHETGTATFAYEALMNTDLSLAVAYPLMLGFLAGLLVKLPAFPLHTWLPNAYTEAPASGSIILSGLMVKTAAYALIRFVLPLFPEASGNFAPVGMLLGVIGILYGAKLAFAQTDIKRIVAYSSFSHMGYIILGVFAFNQLALQGVVMQMVAHGISSTALFAMVGFLETRLGTRDINQIGGLYGIIPYMGGIGLVFVMASLGLPGLANFVAEFLVLMGAYQADILLAVLASIGLILSSIYALRLMQGIFYGPASEKPHQLAIPDFKFREGLIMGVLVVVVVGLGFYPQPVFKTAERSLKIITKPVMSNSSASYSQVHPQKEKVKPKRSPLLPKLNQ